MKVKFTKTGQYGCGPDNEDDVYTVEEFRGYCEAGAFMDTDGFGHPVDKDRTIMGGFIEPSRLNEIPEDATHVVWYNK